MDDDRPLRNLTGKLFEGLQQIGRVRQGRVGRCCALPVGPMDYALYLQFLLQSSKSASAINSAFYALK